MSFSPVVRVRKFMEKMKSERSSPRLKRFPSRTISEEASSSGMEIPAYKSRKNLIIGDNHFAVLPVEAVLLVLSFLEARDVCRLEQSCKEMQFFCNDESIWKNLCVFDWGINSAFTITWKQSYAALDDLCADGVWEGMSKWIEPAGFDNEQKTTARLHFVKRSRATSIIPAVRSSPAVLKRVDSQTTNPPITRTDSASAGPNHRTAPYKIIGSGVTVNCATPSPFKIEGQRTIADPSGCTFEWNKQFEKHTSVYAGKMEYATRTVNGTIDYNDGTTHWKGVFYYTKQSRKGTKLVMA